ncbi:hypothetical protein [Roseivirga pacifica]|uniref:hypothetical protein n=1 Tax=Roseivirga pacifica TaxID=1267423 RepID=UPI003BA9521B
MKKGINMEFVNNNLFLSTDLRTSLFREEERLEVAETLFYHYLGKCDYLFLSLVEAYIEWLSDIIKEYRSPYFVDMISIHEEGKKMANLYNHDMRLMIFKRKFKVLEAERA